MLIILSASVQGKSVDPLDTLRPDQNKLPSWLSILKALKCSKIAVSSTRLPRGSLILTLAFVTFREDGFWKQKPSRQTT